MTICHRLYEFKCPKKEQLKIKSENSVATIDMSRIIRKLNFKDLRNYRIIVLFYIQNFAISDIIINKNVSK